MGVEVLSSDNAKLADGVQEETTQNEEANVIQTFSGFETAEAPNGAIGSINVQDKKLHQGVVDMDVPKDAKSEWPEPKQVHTFYMVRYKSYEEPQLKQKMDHAEKDLRMKNQAGSQILESLKARKREKFEVIEKLKPLTSEEKSIKKRMDEKRKEMEPFQTALAKFKSASATARERGQGLCSSVEELEKTIKALNFKIEHDNNTMEQDKQMIKELERLKKSRGQVMAIEAMNTKLQETMGEKEVVQDSYRVLGANMDELRKQLQAIRNTIKPLEDELSGILAEISSLQEQYNVANGKSDKAYETVKQLKTERNVGNAPFFQYRAAKTTAEHLASKGDKASVEKIVQTEVEKFMSLWNSNKTFREDYIKRFSSYQMRNSDGQPPVSNGGAGLGSNVVKDIIKTENVVAKRGKNLINSVVADLNGVPKENEKHVKVTKTTLHETDPEDDEVHKDNSSIKHEVDVMLLKEKRREEEIAKAIQAQERKKKQAEKAQAKAAAKSQKDAEKKSKEREKKARKKAVVAAGAQGLAPEAVPATEDEAANSDAQAERKITEDTKKDKITETNENLRHRNTNLAMKLKGKAGKPSFPKSALKKKQSFPSWLWAAAVMLLALVLLVIGYYYVL